MHFLSDQTTSKGVEKLQVESSIAESVTKHLLCERQRDGVLGLLESKSK